MIYGKWTDWKDEVVSKIKNQFGDDVVFTQCQFDIFPAFDELVVIAKSGKMYKALLNKGLSQLEFVEIKKEVK